MKTNMKHTIENGCTKLLFGIKVKANLKMFVLAQKEHPTLKTADISD